LQPAQQARVVKTVQEFNSVSSVRWVRFLHRNARDPADRAAL